MCNPFFLSSPEKTKRRKLRKNSVPRKKIKRCVFISAPGFFSPPRKRFKAFSSSDAKVILFVEIVFNALENSLKPVPYYD